MFYFIPFSPFPAIVQPEPVFWILADMGFQAVVEFLCRFVHDAVLFLFRELVVRCVRLDGRQDFDDVVVRPVLWMKVDTMG